MGEASHSAWPQVRIAGPSFRCRHFLFKLRQPVAQHLIFKRQLSNLLAEPCHRDSELPSIHLGAVRLFGTEIKVGPVQTAWQQYRAPMQTMHESLLGILSRLPHN